MRVRSSKTGMSYCGIFDLSANLGVFDNESEYEDVMVEARRLSLAS